jgi:hypothetical protein
MKRSSTIFAVIVNLSFTLCAHAAPWQLVLETVNSASTRVVSASPIAAKGKKLAHPGLGSSVETHRAKVTWYNNNAEVFSSTTEVPFGNRFDNRCSYYIESCPSSLDGTSIIRLDGPDSTVRSDKVRIDFWGVVSRLGGEVEDPTARSSVEHSLDLLKAAAVYKRDGAIGVTKLVSTGSNSNRFVLVIVGDGYRSQDISNGTYSSDANTIVTYLKSQSPWDQLLKMTNIYLVNVVSNQAGTDDPCSEGGSCTVKSADTYFNTSFGTSGIDRLLAPDSTGITRAINVADASVGSGVWDSIVMIVNSSKYGGSGGYISTTSMHSAAPDVAVHEMGHSIGGLADEYEDPYPGFPSTITEPNVDSNGSNPKWKLWVTPGTPLPTSESASYASTVVGAFEGARYKSSGVYRPKTSCKMRYLGVPFCPVCKEAMFEGVLGQVRLYDSTLPPVSSTIRLATAAKTFTVRPIKGGTMSYSWSLCGKKLAGAATASVAIKKSQLTSSLCSLTATLRFTSALLKKKRHTKTITWKVSR